MGADASKEMPSKAERPVSRRINATRVHSIDTSEIDRRIQDVLKAKKAQRLGKGGKDTSFNKVIMKFPQISKAFHSVRRAFDAFDRDKTGTIDYDELSEAMRRLGADLDQREVSIIFQTADMYSTKELSFKEFVVCLAIGYLLDLMPQFESADKFFDRLASKELSASERAAYAEEKALAEEEKYAACAKEETKYLEKANLKINLAVKDHTEESKYNPSEPPLSPSNRRIASLRSGSFSGHRRSASGLFGVGEDLTKAFNLIIDAWLHFDKSGSGWLSKEDMRAVMHQASLKSPTKKLRKKRSEPVFTFDPTSDAGGSSGGSKGGSYGFLTEERFKELDWDGAGNIGFREFLVAFEGWIGMEDDE